MANDYNIPTIGKQVKTPVPVQPGKVDFSSFAQQDPNLQLWAGLSKSIGALGATIGNIGQLEQEQEKIMEQYYEGMDVVADEIRRRGGSQEAVEEVLREQELAIRKQGIIKAYEGFVYMDAIDKSRSQARLARIEELLLREAPRLTNPGSKESVDSVMTDVWAMADDEPLYDVNGNLISFDPLEMTTGEILEFQAGLNAIKLGVSRGAAEKKEERAVEGYTQLQGEEVYNVLSQYHSNPQELSANLERVMANGYVVGVHQPNQLLLTSIESWANDYLEQTGDIDAVNRAITNLQGEVTTRVQDGRHILFASKGTENYQKLEDLRDDMNKQYLAGLTAKAKEEKDQYELLGKALTRYGTSMMAGYASQGIPIDDKAWREIVTILIEEADAYGYAEIDTIIGHLDTTRQTLDYAPNQDPQAYARYRMDVTRNRFSREELGILRTQVFEDFGEGIVTVQEFDKLMNEIDGHMAKLDNATAPESIADKAAKESGFGFSSPDAEVRRLMSDVLKMNNKAIKGYVGKFEFVTGIEGGLDDAPLPKFYGEVESRWLEGREAAVYGGTFTVPPIELAPEDLTLLVERGVSPDQVADTYNFFKDGVTVEWDGPVKSPDEARKRASEMMKVVRAYAELQGMKQMIYLDTATWANIDKEVEPYNITRPALGGN